MPERRYMPQFGGFEYLLSDFLEMSVSGQKTQVILVKKRHFRSFSAIFLTFIKPPCTVALVRPDSRETTVKPQLSAPLHHAKTPDLAQILQICQPTLVLALLYSQELTAKHLRHAVQIHVKTEHLV